MANTRIYFATPAEVGKAVVNSGFTVSKLFIGAAGIAFGASLIKNSINDVRGIQEYCPSENLYEE